MFAAAGAVVVGVVVVGWLLLAVAVAVWLFRLGGVVAFACVVPADLTVEL